MNKFSFIFFLAVLLYSCGGKETSEQKIRKDSTKVDTLQVKKPKAYQKIITLGKTITGIVVNLGIEDRLVAVDRVYNTLPITAKLPNIGYGKLLKSKKIKKYQPDIVISSDKHIPNEIVRSLEKDEITCEVHTIEHSLEGYNQLIRHLAEILAVKSKGEKLIRTIESDISIVQEKTKDIKQKVKIAYIYATNEDNAMISGTNTPINLLIELAGAKNAFDGFEGLKRIEEQDLVEAAPNIYMMTKQDFETFGGKASLIKVPGYYSTYAGKMGSLILIDKSLLDGLGSDLGKNVSAFAKKLYPNRFVEKNP